LEQRELLARLRAVVEAKDAEIGLLHAELAAERKRLELQVAGLQRRLGMDSTDSGTPTSRKSIEAKERRKAMRRNRQQSERERRKESRTRASPADAELLAKLRQRYDEAAAFGITYNRHRD
jgi:hypothetical protein